MLVLPYKPKCATPQSHEAFSGDPCCPDLGGIVTGQIAPKTHQIPALSELESLY